MKQIARRDLTLLDKIEIAKKATFQIKKIRWDYIYSIKIIFKDKDNQDRYITMQFNKDHLRYALPLLDARSFTPGEVFPNIQMITSLFEKNLFYYPKGHRPVWKSKYQVSEYQQAILKTKTTYRLSAYRLLSAIRDFIKNEEAPQ